MGRKSQVMAESFGKRIYLKMKARCGIVALLFSLVGYCSVAIADDPEIYSYRSKGAVKGVDVVAYFSLSENAKAVKGSNEFTVQWKGATWRFSSEENRKAFSVAPDKYAPQYGGYCAFAVSHGFVTAPRPNNWKIVDGKLYLNNNRRSFKKWLGDYENKIKKADKNWPEVLKD